MKRTQLKSKTPLRSKTPLKSKGLTLPTNKFGGFSGYALRIRTR